jgi:hypothetical protein
MGFSPKKKKLYRETLTKKRPENKIGYRRKSPSQFPQGPKKKPTETGPAGSQARQPGELPRA